MKIQIRFVESKDMQQIIELCEAHAQYEKSDYSTKNKAVQLSKDLFSETPKLYCLVVESDNELIGYATYMKQYATWNACEYMYMDCLFIKDMARGFGIGEKLVKRIQKEGKKLNCILVQWQTPSFNTRAMKFYKRIGATSKSKERFFLSI